MTITATPRKPNTAEWLLTREYARGRASLRGRLLTPELRVGRNVITSQADQYPGLGYKFLDLGGGLRSTPTAIETKLDFNYSSLYTGIGQILAKRSLFAADFEVDPQDVESVLLFGDAGFDPRDVPPAARVIGDALSAAGIKWVVRHRDGNNTEFVELTTDL